MYSSILVTHWFICFQKWLQKCTFRPFAEGWSCCHGNVWRHYQRHPRSADIYINTGLEADVAT